MEQLFIHGNVSCNYWESIELVFEILTLFCWHHLGLVAAGTLFTRAFDLRRASSGAFTSQEHAVLVGDDAALIGDDAALVGDDAALCTVCWDAPNDSFFDPCGHRCTCYSCGMRSLSSTNFFSFFWLSVHGLLLNIGIHLLNLLHLW